MTRYEVSDEVDDQTTSGATDDNSEGFEGLAKTPCQS